MKIFAYISVLTFLITITKLGNSKRVKQVLKSHHSKVFDNYKKRYGRKYRDESEQLYRNLVVYKNINKIAYHNLEVPPNYISQNNSYEMAMNVFSDLSQDQFRLRYTNYMLPDQRIRQKIVIQEKKQQITKTHCQCDSNFVRMINQIKNNQNMTNFDIKNMADSYKNKRNKQKAKIQQKISMFIKEIQNLDSDQYRITQEKLRQLVMQYSEIDPNFLTKLLKENPHLISTLKLNLRKQDSLALPKKLKTNPFESSLQQKFSKQFEQQNILSSLGNQQIVKILLKNGPLSATLLNNASSSRISAAMARNIMASSSPSNFNLSTFQVDWTSYTGPVRHQGQCGSCYALVAVNNLEALLAIYVLGFHIQLSPQQIIQCAQNGLTFGCSSGYLQGSFLFMKDRGISTQYIYPYTSMDSGFVSPCKLDNGPFKISSFKNLPQGDCLSLKKQLAKKPVSVAISSENLQFYSSGVFTGCTMKVDHAVLLVGFNPTKGWRIKNTWGSEWGENGYAWIKDGNSCGICEGPTVATVAGELPKIIK